MKNYKTERPTEQEREQVKQRLLMEYLLDPFITYEEAKKLAELAVNPGPYRPSANDQRAFLSTPLVLVVG